MEPDFQKNRGGRGVRWVSYCGDLTIPEPQNMADRDLKKLVGLGAFHWIRNLNGSRLMCSKKFEQKHGRHDNFSGVEP